MSDLPLRVTHRDEERYRNPWLAPSTSTPLLSVLLLVVVVFFPSLFTPHTPERMDFSAILQPSGLRHWLSTDQLGCDVFTRVMYGTSLSLSIRVGMTLIASVGGTVLGILAGLAPGTVWQLLVWLLGTMLAFPDLLLVLLAITVLGYGSENTLQAVGLAGIADYARLVCAQVLQVRSSGYAQYAVALGEPPVMITLHRIILDTLRPLLVLATVGIGYSISPVSALSFLGLGVTPSTVEWGALLSEGRNFLDNAPWISLLPASVVALSVTIITLLGRRAQALITRSGVA